jgi:hypothetical protein
MVSHTGFHCGSHAQSLVDPANYTLANIGDISAFGKYIEAEKVARPMIKAMNLGKKWLEEMLDPYVKSRTEIC